MDKLRKGLYQVSEGLELIIALVAVIGVVIATLNLFPELLLYWQNRTDAEAFLIFLDAVFDVVIGLEFIKMLCKPSSQNIMEVLIFLIARHMIVQKTSALEYYFSSADSCLQQNRIKSSMCRNFLGQSEMQEIKRRENPQTVKSKRVFM